MCAHVCACILDRTIPEIRSEQNPLDAEADTCMSIVSVEGYRDLEPIWGRKDGVQEFRLHRECCGERSQRGTWRGMAFWFICALVRMHIHKLHTRSAQLILPQKDAHFHGHACVRVFAEHSLRLAFFLNMPDVGHVGCAHAHVRHNCTKNCYCVWYTVHKHSPACMAIMYQLGKLCRLLIVLQWHL
jgi:hypothetical protein